MSQPAEWGDQITLMAAARLLNREIRVVSASGVTIVASGQNHCSPLLAYISVRYDAVFPKSPASVLVSPSLNVVPAVDLVDKLPDAPKLDSVSDPSVLLLFTRHRKLQCNFFTENTLYLISLISLASRKSDTQLLGSLPWRPS